MTSQPNPAAPSPRTSTASHAARAAHGRSSVSERAVVEFHRIHGRSPSGVWSAPGRVNFIGEHTDYNDGFVLPFALPHRIAVAASPREDGVLAAVSVGDDGAPQRGQVAAIADLAPGVVTGWSAYPAGVAWALREYGVLSEGLGADLVITGDVPAGAGLSSSHALECAVALALLGLHGLDPDSDADTDRRIDRSTLARLVQRSENDFVGAPTGILDQTASLMCTADHLLFLDVRSGEQSQIPFAPAQDGLAVLVTDTRATHSHSESGYGQRRAGCEEAAQLLGVPALRDVTDLPTALAALPERLRPLVRHVVTENERVLAVVDALRQGRLETVGSFLTASHESLRDDYRVSAPELDVAVDAALGAGALGARMTGGGFGGSSLALVREETIQSSMAAITRAFAAAGFAAPRHFVAVPSAGAGHDTGVDLRMR